MTIFGRSSFSRPYYAATSPMPQDKLAAYDRNIIAAENALEQAKADHDTDAYNRARGC